MTSIFLVVLAFILGAICFFILSFSTSTFCLNKSKMAQKLNQQISKIIINANTKVEVESYKWFGDIAHLLLNLKSKIGVEVIESFKILREFLLKDIELEKNNFSEVSSASFQFFIISILTIVFHISFSKIIQESSLLDLAFPLLIQFIGVTIFFFFRGSFYLRMFSEVDTLIESCLRFYVLSKSTLPTKKILEISLGSIGSIRNKELNQIYKNYISTIDNWSKVGGSIPEEIRVIMSELNINRESIKKKFLQFVNVLKFLVLALFFLPSYLYLILRVTSSFLIE